jgi:hypothetical protein
MCFLLIWKPTAIISLYSINWLVFITEILKGYIYSIFVLSTNVLQLGEKGVNQDIPTWTHLPGLVTEFRAVSSCYQQIRQARKEYGVVLSVVTYHWIKQQTKHAYLSKCSLSEGRNTSVCGRNAPINFLPFCKAICKASITKFPGKYRLHVTKKEVQWRPLIIIADNVINLLLLSKSVVPKHSI